MLDGLLHLPWWGDLLIILVTTHITIVSVTVYLHRNQAHRALDLHPLASHFFRFHRPHGQCEESHRRPEPLQRVRVHHDDDDRETGWTQQPSIVGRRAGVCRRRLGSWPAVSKDWTEPEISGPVAHQRSVPIGTKRENTVLFIAH